MRTLTHTGTTTSTSSNKTFGVKTRHREGGIESQFTDAIELSRLKSTPTTSMLMRSILILKVNNNRETQGVSGDHLLHLQLTEVLT